MAQAMYTSMTGMNAGQDQLTVVSDNVANMNTTAYKTSRVDFQDIWYQTSTTGTNSTPNSGGTNPYQIGVGVQCASISKDFEAASTVTTGRAEDMAITGDGRFSVINSDGQVLLTRDGTFSLDENGFLCTADGSKVLGMNQNTSLMASTIPIKVPTSIKVMEGGTTNDDGTFESIKLADLNSLGSSNDGIRSGTFNVVVGTADANGKITYTDCEITIDENTTLGDVAGWVADINDDAVGFNVTVEDGFLKFNPTCDTNIASVPKNNDGSYDTKLLNTSATIG